MLFLCPKCMKRLTVRDGSAVCEAGHSYDRCRAGYYNLLMSNKSSSHGDNKQMVEARRIFLSGGYYKPLSDAIAETVCENTEALAAVLDAEAGEGYYTDAVERALYDRDGDSRVYAFDISKDAVREIGKKNKRISLAVAGSYHMPIADGDFDAVVNTFSPLALSETARVLRTGGIFVMAIPDTEHLFELKAAIYDTPYKNEVADTSLDGFELISDRSIKYVMHLPDRESIAALFGMTPYAYRTGAESRERVYSLDKLDCTAAFRLLLYRKT